MDKSPKEIARHYSKTIFERAKETGSIAEWSETLKSLADLVQMPQVNRLITGPRTTTEELVDFMRETMIGTTASWEEKKLVTDLAKDRSLQLLPLICSYYKERETDASESKEVLIKTAFPLDEAQVSFVTKYLRDRFNVLTDSTVVEVDKSLIGGVIIQFDDIVIDDSIRGKLQALEKALMAP
jgi:F-type H+-transporting ATPase subunit delta